MQKFGGIALVVALIATLSMAGGQAPQSQPTQHTDQEITAKKIRVQELELVDAEGKVHMRARVDNGTVIAQIGAGSSQLVLASNEQASQIQIRNCGQIRSSWGTDVRHAPNGEEEPGVTELVFSMPKRDPETLEPVKKNGRVQMKEVFGIEAHDGRSPGLKGKPESWIGVRMTNGVQAGEGNSPVFEAYHIADWTPMEMSMNQPYLKKGRSQFIFWGKEKPFDLSIRDGNNGKDTVLAELTVDGKECPYQLGTTTGVLNPTPDEKK